MDMRSNQARSALKNTGQYDAAEKLGVPYPSNSNRASPPRASSMVVPVIGASIWLVLIVSSHLLQNREDLSNLAFWTDISTAQILLVGVLPLIALRFMRAVEQRVNYFGQTTSRLEHSVTRFLEPTDTVGGNVVSIRHAVSSELAALTDHLDRALTKSGAIEEKIRGEITALDRTFQENEHRLMGLIQELARQRESVITSTDQVRTSVTETRETLNAELVQLCSQVMEAGNYARSVMSDLRTDFDSSVTGAAETIEANVRAIVTDRIDPIIAHLEANIEGFTSLLDTGSGSLKATLAAEREALAAQLTDSIAQLNRELQSGTEAASNMLSRSDGMIEQSLDSVVNRLETRIKSGTLELLSVLDKGGQTAAERIDDAAKTAHRSMDEQLSGLAGHLALRIGELRTLTAEAEHNLVPALDGVSRRVASASELAASLEATTDKLSRTLTNDVGNVVEVLEGKIETFETQIATAGEGAAQRMVERLEEALESVDQHAGQFGTAVQSVRDTISLAADKFTIAASEHNLMASQSINDLTGALEQGTRDLSNLIETELNALDGALSKGLADYSDLLIDKAEGISALLKDARATGAEDLTRGIAALSAAAQSANDQLRQTLSGMVTDLKTSLDTQRKDIEDHSKSTAQAIADRTRTAADELNRAGQSIVSQIASELDHTKREFTGAVSGLAAPIDGALSELMGELTTRTSTFQNAIEGRARKLEDVVADATSRLEDQTSRLQRTVSQKLTGLERFLTEGNEEMEGALAAHLEELRKVFEEAREKREASGERETQVISTVLEARGELLDAILRSRGQEFTDRLHAASQGFETTLSDLGARISRGVADGAEELSSRTASQVAGLSRELQAVSGQLEDMLATEAQALRSELTAMVDSISGLMGEERASLVDAFEARIRMLEKVIATGIDDVARTSDVEADNFARRIETGRDALKSVLGRETERLATGMSAHVQMVRDAVSEAAEQVAGLVKTANKDLETTVARSTEAAATSLGQTSQKLIKQVASSVEQVEHSLNSGSESVMSRIASHEKAAVRRIEQAAAAVEESTRRAAEVTVDRLVALNGVVTQAISSNTPKRPRSGKPSVTDAAE